MNKLKFIGVFLALLLLWSCKKKDDIAQEPGNLKMFGFGVIDNHQIFRTGDQLRIVQPIANGSYEVRSIDILSLDQSSPVTLDVQNILANAGVSNFTFIGASDFVMLSNGNIAISALVLTGNSVQLRIIRLNSAFEFTDISAAIQGSSQPNSVYSSPAVSEFDGFIYATYIIKNNNTNTIDMKSYKFNMGNLSSSGLGTVSIPVGSIASVEQGAKLQLACNSAECVAYCNMNPEQFLKVEISNSQFVSMQNQPITDFDIAKHYALYAFHNIIFSGCDKTDFAGIAPLVMGESYGLNNTFQPQLQFVKIDEGNLTISVRSILTDPSSPDFSTILFYDAQGNLKKTLTPEEIPIRTPRYVYADQEEDNTYTLLGLTPENQAFILRVDNDGKIISF